MSIFCYNDHLTFKTRILNLFRRIFKFQPIERILARLTSGKLPSSIISRFVPPEYLYSSGTTRKVVRHDINFSLDISKVVDHFIFFDFKDAAFNNLMKMIKEDSVIFDIGANVGRFSFHFAKLAHQGKVVCFEPDSKNFSDLMKTEKLNNYHNISFLKKGLGSEKNLLPLYRVNESNPGMNRILKNIYPNGRSEEIEIIKLDDYIELSDFEDINIIKIDVEGYEHEVLKGGEKIIKRLKPILFVEVNDQNLKEHNSSALDLVSWIRSKGYTIKNASTNQYLSDNPFEVQSDILCTPELTSVING